MKVFVGKIGRREWGKSRLERVFPEKPFVSHKRASFL